jgi:hypothetical protein
MNTRSKVPDARLLLRTLAEFRYELRQFLHFSERAAVEAGLQPQQHQLLLQVAGASEGQAVTIAAWWSWSTDRSAKGCWCEPWTRLTGGERFYK